MVRGIRIVRTERIICSHPILSMNRMVSWVSLKMRRLSKTWKEFKALFKWISGVGPFQAERATIGTKNGVSYYVKKQRKTTGLGHNECTGL